ncbi:magnesium transporter NIPA3 [Zerene cesonia]|uniref:magnesium transporter NIPA3 n=1 Tax=Zerene cesonia TaxID=33412 RepID=UPI0018E57452|nr:magnesium transporter NIPA3 [Zerene cesonia]
MPAVNSQYSSYILGLTLAISSSIFIGSSFVIKKIALNKITAKGNLRASAGGFSYLKQWMWWLGLATMGLGEAANLLAYAFVPASLVTPLGALSILVTAILSSKFLDEKLHFLGKIGCILCVIGSVILILHAPKSDVITNFPDIITRLSDSIFIFYVCTVFILVVIVRTFFAPKYGKTNITIYLIICSAIGSLTVVFCKAVALGIKDGINIYDTSIYTFFVLLVMAVFGIMVQLNYLNKSIDIFSTTIVTPVYYVMFTTLVILASSILFKEWQNMENKDVIGCVFGFIMLIIAVFTLNMFKDLKNVN